MRPFAEVVERFWSHVDRSGECWLWTLKKRQIGYGDTTRPITAFAWIVTHGSLPTDKRVIHSCANLNCVRPEHLQLGTCADLVRRVHDHPNRGSKKGAKWKRPRTECNQGHSFAVYGVVRKDGARRCRKCHNLGQQRRRQTEQTEELSPLVAKLLAGARL